MLDIRPLSDSYAVAPQIDPEDFAAIRAAGYATVIDNRPDAEIAPSHHAGPMREAAEAAGLVFVANPVLGGALTMENVTAQGAAMEASAGPVLAYCASGNRSAMVWLLGQAGRAATDALLEATTRAGYQHGHLRPQIEALAAERRLRAL